MTETERQPILYHNCEESFFSLPSILLEPALLGVARGSLGIILAFVARQGLYLFPSIGSAIQIEIATETVIFTIVFATVVGTVSGLYPAIRASRMKPTAAFRPK